MNNNPAQSEEKKSGGGATVHTIQLIGNIGVAPEYKNKPDQQPFCVFTMAVNRALKKGREVEKLWVRVTLWGRLAETAVKYALKAQQVYVEGRFVISEWTDKEGKMRYTLEVEGADFQMLGSPLDALKKEAERLDRVEDERAAQLVDTNSSSSESPLAKGY